MRQAGWRSGLTVAAVFWALAVGMAVGAGAVSSRMVDRGLLAVVESRLGELETRLARVSGELGRTRRELSLYRQVAQHLLPMALVNRLPAGLEVAVQATPGARTAGEQLAQLLSSAGAVVTVQGSAPGGGAEWVALRTPGAVVVGLVGTAPSGLRPGAGPRAAAEPYPAATSRSAAGVRSPNPSSPLAVGGPSVLGQLPPKGAGTGVAPTAAVSVAWVDGIDEPLGMLAAVEALLSCPRGRVAPEEALIRFGRRGGVGAFQRDRACLAGGDADRSHRGRPAPP